MVVNAGEKFNFDIKNLKDDELLTCARKLAGQERALCVQLLHYLMVIEDRRLYAKRGYSSLYDFVIQELKYSQGAAYRRIQAMRLMRGVPEVKEKIESGSLSLTNAAQVQRFVRAERKVNNKKYQRCEKLELVQSIESQSTRECEKALRAISPSAVPNENERVLSDQETEIRFVADESLMKKIGELKQLFSHVNPNPSYLELFHLLADRAITQKRKQRGLQKSKFDGSNVKEQTSAPRSARVKNHRHIAAQLKREIYERDGGECCYRDSLTGRKCQSKFQLEIDHVKPVALGGNSESRNLRMLCREHNALMAELKLGARTANIWRSNFRWDGLT